MDVEVFIFMFGTLFGFALGILLWIIYDKNNDWRGLN